MTKTFKFLMILMVAAFTLSATACTRVNAGEVGVMISNVGSHKGVQPEPLPTGLVTYNPFFTKIITLPTTRQTKPWTLDAKEGSDRDQSINFNSIEGAAFSADVSMSYSFVPEKAPNLIKIFNKSPEKIMDVDVFNIVRDAFQIRAGRMQATKLYGEQKQELLDSVTYDVKKQLEPLGFNINSIGFLHLRIVDENVKNSINAVLAQSQQAQQAIAKIRQDSAQAMQKMMQARGDSAQFVIRAQGQAEANRLTQATITDKTLADKALSKWDGVLPVVGSGSGTIIDINSLIKAKQGGN